MDVAKIRIIFELATKCYKYILDNRGKYMKNYFCGGVIFQQTKYYTRKSITVLQYIFKIYRIDVSGPTIPVFGGGIMNRHRR